MKRFGLTLILLFMVIMSVWYWIGHAQRVSNMYSKENSQSDTSYTCTSDTILQQVEEQEDSHYIVTEEEREMLARLVFLEASICSMDCQQAVVSVVFNRLESGRWKKDMNSDGQITLYDVVYYPNAFSPSSKIATTIPDQESYSAVDYVIKYGPTVPTEVRYFRTDYDFSWDNYSNYCIMDNVYFGYFTNWKQGAW